MTRLVPTGGDPDDDLIGDPRRLAAEVPRYGWQAHPEPSGESTDDLYLLDEPANNTLPHGWTPDD